MGCQLKPLQARTMVLFETAESCNLFEKWSFADATNADQPVIPMLSARAEQRLGPVGPRLARLGSARHAHISGVSEAGQHPIVHWDATRLGPAQDSSSISTRSSWRAIARPFHTRVFASAQVLRNQFNPSVRPNR